MNIRTLLALAVIAPGLALAQVPSETTDDPNKQQVVPELADIPKPAAGYGTVTGQFIWDGPVPEKELMHKKGDPVVKDPETCADIDQFKNDLVVNKENKGIRNIFIYEKSGTYKKKPDAIFPALRKPPKDSLFFDQKGCRYFPKSLLVRAGQNVVALSNDDVIHNVHTYPVKNQGLNTMIGANDRDGDSIIELPKAETLPISVKCDFHTWMTANWLILDHPYMAITNADGRFMIANMPPGKHEIRLWHERPGYIHKKIKTAKTPEYLVKSSKMYIEVKAGEVLNLKQIKLKPEWFPKQ